MQITSHITLGEYVHRLELLKNGIDLTGAEIEEHEFIMLRSYEFRNTVIYDTELYFIDREIFADYVKQLSQSGKDGFKSGLIFPIANNDYESFSLDISDFNQDMDESLFKDKSIDELIKNPNMISPLVYRLYRKSDIQAGIERDAKIKCDKLRIYRPHNKRDIDFIVHCDTYINNIHVHILARDINWYSRQENKDKYIKSTTEFKSGHNFYSEYIEIPIPDLDDLFVSGDVYFIENLNFGDICFFEDKYKDKLSKQFSSYIYKKNKKQYNSLGLFKLPFTLEKYGDLHNLMNGYYLIDNNGYYLKDNKDRFLLWKEGGTDTAVYLTDNNNNYIIDSIGNYLICTQVEGQVNVYALDDPNFNLYEAYIKHYVPEYMHTTAIAHMKNQLNVSFVPYDTNTCSIKEAPGFSDASHMLVRSDSLDANREQLFIQAKIRLTSKIGWDENGIISILNEFQYPEKGKFRNFSEAYEYYNGISLDNYTNIVDDTDEDNWWDDSSESSMQCGIVFEIFGDIYQKDRLYRESHGFAPDPVTGKLEIDDFAFNLTSLFTEWSQYPGLVYCRCKFVDKYLGKVIYGSIVTLTKEHFKYLINDIYKGKAILSKKPSNNTMDVSKFNFLNNIQINVVSDKSKTEQQIQQTSKQANRTKVVFKPVFYKVQDLPQIRLREGIIQNIGINLMEYMTKVETFKLIIGGLSIIEHARNDAYVVFNIDTNKIDLTRKKEYHILTQDDEYISSGSWEFIN